ncbi:hypothetical protein PpBr36_02125 [Pyricularia pennisetigena]|uniref:hypothetical protein n=1 Tax=Pyricularia pennisetigena TaxID=1578925 RepID=UPI00115332A6|nr:hypothetical protein PpBr36_02125 [Pyricularia pennisetigena]TLS28395.1 hypothetical protein PpBr36_02125 [Pyricularia pennisetigena]
MGRPNISTSTDVGQFAQPQATEPLLALAHPQSRDRQPGYTSACTKITGAARRLHVPVRAVDRARRPSAVQRQCRLGFAGMRAHGEVNRVRHRDLTWVRGLWDERSAADGRCITPHIILAPLIRMNRRPSDLAAEKEEG